MPISVDDVQVQKKDVVKFKFLKKIYDKDGISQTSIRASLRISEITLKNLQQFWIVIGAIEIEKTSDGDRPITKHHITPIGIAILVNAKLIIEPKKEMPQEEIKENKSKSIKYDVVKSGNIIYPTPTDMYEIYHQIKGLDDTIFFKTVSPITMASIVHLGITTYRDLPVKTRIIKVLNKYKELYEEKDIDGMTIHIGILYEELNPVKKYLRHSKKFFKIYDNMCTILDKDNDLNI